MQGCFGVSEILLKFEIKKNQKINLPVFLYLYIFSAARLGLKSETGSLGYYTAKIYLVSWNQSNQLITLHNKNSCFYATALIHYTT